MTERYKGPFSYGTRINYAEYTLGELPTLKNELASDPAQVQVVETAIHKLTQVDQAFRKALNELREEENEDAEMEHIEIQEPEKVEQTLKTLFALISICGQKIWLSGDSQKQEQWELFEQQVLRGRSRSDLVSSDELFSFVEHLDEQLDQHPVAHYKEGTLEIPKLVKTLRMSLQDNRTKRAQEKAETFAARREVWRTAKQWDYTYRAVRALIQGILILNQRGSEHARFFLDVQERQRKTAASSSPQE
ncbi:MAG: hypothetical protein AAGJ35_05590 [Myxococcota bacterium]